MRNMFACLAQFLSSKPKMPSEHIKALTHVETLTSPKTVWEIWSHYCLGRYRTVSMAKKAPSRPMAVLARAVSKAACGEFDEAADLARAVVRRLDKKPHLHLAREMAAYLPELSAEIAPSTAHDLRAALYLELGDHALAAQAMGRARAQPGPTPDLVFIERRLREDESCDPAALNRFLNAHALSPVSLVEDRRPATPANLRSAIELPSTRGPLVSVVMTCFNTERRVGSAIRSLLSQTYETIEVIVVDDCSTDDTAAVVEAIAKLDSRVQLVRLPLNCGTYAAKMAGMALARGEFFTCHDSDDWSHPMKVQMQIEPLLAAPSMVCTISDWVRIDDDGQACCRQLFPLTRLNPSSPLYRRKVVLDRMGGYDLVRSGADSEFMARMRLVFGEEAVARIRLPLSFGAHRPGSLMTDPKTGISGRTLSPTRLEYWEAWTAWLVREARAGRSPVMPAPGQARSFSASGDMALTLPQLRTLDDFLETIEKERRFA